MANCTTGHTANDFLFGETIDVALDFDDEEFENEFIAEVQSVVEEVSKPVYALYLRHLFCVVLLIASLGLTMFGNSPFFKISYIRQKLIYARKVLARFYLFEFSILLLLDLSPTPKKKLSMPKIFGPT